MEVFLERCNTLFRQYILIVLVLPLFLAGACFAYFYETPYYVVKPGNDNRSQNLFEYTEANYTKDGKSEIEILKSTYSETIFRYVLRKGNLYPTACIDYSMDKGHDMSVYDDIKIRVKASKGKRILMTLFTLVGYLKMPDGRVVDHNRPSRTILNTGPEFKEFTVPISEMATPEWWYTDFNRKEKDWPAANFKNLYVMTVSSCINLPTNVEDVITVQEISYHVNLSTFYWISGGLLALYYSVITFFWLNKKTKEQPEICFEEESSPYSLSEEETLVFGFLTTNYSKQELCIADVVKATGIPERRVSIMVKNKSGMPFKQFLNKLRLTEAKRLLAETDFQISEIAFKVGYINISSFNRVFKAIEECSPNDYRKQEMRRFVPVTNKLVMG